MIFEFRIKCKDEKNNFALTILIDENQTFLDFHNSIQICSCFETAQMASFFISDEVWTRGTEITLIEISDDLPSMESTKINEHIKSKGDKVIYLFDFFSDRFYKMELVNILEKTPIKNLPTCTQADGDVPKQIIIDDDMDFMLDNNTEYNDDFENDSSNFENIDDLDI